MDEDWSNEENIFKNSETHDQGYSRKQVILYNFLRQQYLEKFKRFSYKR